MIADASRDDAPLAGRRRLGAFLPFGPPLRLRRGDLPASTRHGRDCRGATQRARVNIPHSDGRCPRQLVASLSAGWLLHALEARASEERHPEVLLERRQAAPVREPIRAESGPSAADEAIEADEPAGHEPAVPDDVERQVQGRAEHIAPQPVETGPPRHHGQQHQQLVGMKRQHDALHPALEVVPQERRRAQAALLLEHQVVEDVIEVDQESAGRESHGERRVSGEVIGRRTRDGRRDEMSAGTHAARPLMPLELLMTTPGRSASRNAASVCHTDGDHPENHRLAHFGWGTTARRGPAVSGKPMRAMSEIRAAAMT